MRADAHEVRDCFCLHSRRTARCLTQIYDLALRPSGLRVTQFQLLAAIGQAEPVNQQTLADIMGMDRTTLTRNIALLARQGSVDVSTARQDRREHQYRLTLAGRKAVAAALPMWRAAQKTLTRQLQRGQSKLSADAVLQVLDALAGLATGEELATT